MAHQTKPGVSRLPANAQHPKSSGAAQPDAANKQPHVGAGTVPAAGPGSRRLHRKEAAFYLGLSLSWLDKARLKGDGPIYLQIGGRVVYYTHDLDRFMALCRRQSTSSAR